MHSYSTRDRKITVHHNHDWSGDAIITASGDQGQPREGNASAPIDPRSRREIILPSAVVLSGDYERPPNCLLTEQELRRATALSMYAWIIDKAINAIGDIDDPEKITPGVRNRVRATSSREQLALTQGDDPQADHLEGVE